jgi:hypothetical protein
MSAVVVRARFDSAKMEADLWQVKKGDFGVLRWKSDQRRPRLLVPYVVWDRDTERKIRKVVMSSITVVGLQTSRSRVLLLPAPH